MGKFGAKPEEEVLTEDIEEEYSDDDHWSNSDEDDEGDIASLISVLRAHADQDSDYMCEDVKEDAPSLLGPSLRQRCKDILGQRFEPVFEGMKAGETHERLKNMCGDDVDWKAALMLVEQLIFLQFS